MCDIDTSFNTYEKKEDGALAALAAYGSQDEWMKKNPHIFDIRNTFLHTRHSVVYRKLPVEKSAWRRFSSSNNKGITFHVTRSCDLINNLDLMIKNPENIKSVEVEYGGQRFDKIHSFEQIKTSAAIFKRPITPANNEGYGIVPLCLAPFHYYNLALPSTTYHALNIFVEFVEGCEDYNEEEVDIYGNMYYLDNDERRLLLNNSHEFATIQSQYCGPDKMTVAGKNRVNINFNHPVYMIYFYGPDKSKISNIKVKFNEAVYYDGPLLPLEHMKAERGLGHIDPVMIFFSDGAFNAPPKTTVNFSRIDNAVLEVDTTEEESTIHVVGLNCQGVRYVSGMYGMVYSK